MPSANPYQDRAVGDQLANIFFDPIGAEHAAVEPFSTWRAETNPLSSRVETNLLLILLTKRSSVALSSRVEEGDDFAGSVVFNVVLPIMLLLLLVL